MQKEGLSADDFGKELLSGIEFTVRTAEDADLEQYVLSAGSIMLSTDVDVLVEAMFCTGIFSENEDSMEFFMSSLESECYESGKKRWMPPCLTYDFLASRYDDTVISDCQINFTNMVSGEILPIHILGVKLCFGDGRELDYSDKVSIFVLDNLAGAA